MTTTKHPSISKPDLGPPDDLWYGTSGPRDARIMVVAESWGATEVAAKEPLVGESGRLFNSMLQEAGYDRSDVLCTNVVAARPPGNEMWRFFHAKGDPQASGLPAIRGLMPSLEVRSELVRLHRQLDVCRPDLVVAVGAWAGWALTDEFPVDNVKTDGGRATGRKGPIGVIARRGSMYRSLHGNYPVLPIIHPSATLRQWAYRARTVHDLKTRIPQALNNDWKLIDTTHHYPAPSFAHLQQLALDLKQRLDQGPLDIAVDIETSPRRELLVCIGLGWTRPDGHVCAISIPFADVENNQVSSWWPVEHEARIYKWLRWVFAHPNARLMGQNYMYDMQWMKWHFGLPTRMDFDTMLAQHMLFPGTPMGLDHLSSVYCKYHRYWKTDGKEWDEKREGIYDLLRYNCEDVARTLEIAQSQREVIKLFDMEELWQWELRKHSLALRMSSTGVRIDTKLRSKYSVDLMFQREAISQWLESMFPNSVFSTAKTAKAAAWYNSPTQTSAFLYQTLGLKVIKDRKTLRPSTGKEALAELKELYPALRRLFDALLALRSIGVFNSHFIQAKLDEDMRMRSQFKPAGTETFRWASSKNAFNRGTNLQNVPQGNEE